MPARQGLRFCYTLNNYTSEEEEACKDFSSLPVVKYHVFGREVGDSGTPHLQGFLCFKNPHKKTIFWLKQNFSDRAHFEFTRGSNEQASNYCKKDGDFFEHGDIPFGGQRTDLDVVRSWIDDFAQQHGRACTERELAMEHPLSFIRYQRALVHYARVTAPTPTLRGDATLRNWQSELEQELDDPADDRSIIFYVDERGNNGKTFFQQWYISRYSDTTQLLGLGRRDDMAYAVDPVKRIFFINVPRGSMEFLQYSLLEQLKDRLVFSTKYQSEMKVLTYTPHVIVFSNEYPDMNKLSEDRVIIRTEFN